MEDNYWCNYLTNGKDDMYIIFKNFYNNLHDNVVDFYTIKYLWNEKVLQMEDPSLNIYDELD